MASLFVKFLTQYYLNDLDYSPFWKNGGSELGGTYNDNMHNYTFKKKKVKRGIWKNGCIKREVFVIYLKKYFQNN